MPRRRTGETATDSPTPPLHTRARAENAISYRAENSGIVSPQFKCFWGKECFWGKFTHWALCRGICKAVETPLQRRRVITGSWVFAGRLLSPKPAGIAAGAAGISGSAHRPPAATFAFPQADSVAASRVMPSFPRPPRFAEGIFYRWRIRKERAKRHIYPRATLSRFSSRASNTRAACYTRSGSFLPAEIAVPSACAIARFRRKISHALATQRTLCVRTDVHFPSNIGAKGSRREESRIFPKH